MRNRRRPRRLGAACMSLRDEYGGSSCRNQNSLTGPVTTDMAKVRQRKRNMVDREIALHLQNYKISGAVLIMGTGRLVAPKTLEVRLSDAKVSQRALQGCR
jgi:pyruvate/2-oxoglutarate dehydrogenase complex dihydrolipoamide dehydrogenase (E3) component